MVDTRVVRTAVLLLLGAVCLFRSALGVERKPVHSSWYVVAVLYAVLVLHYLWVGYSVAPDTNDILLFGAALIAFARCFRDLAESPDTVERAANVLWGVGGAFVAWNLGVLVLRREDAFMDGSFAGVTANPNMLGGYLALLCFPMLLDFVTTPLRRGRKKALSWSLLVACVILVLLTRSRAALLAMSAVSVVRLLVWAQGSLERKLGLLAAVSSASAGLLLFAGEKYEGMDLLATRSILVFQRLMAIGERPWFGWGFNSSVYSAFDESNIFPAMEKGNTVLQAFEEFGIPLGGIIIAGVAFLAWRAVSRLGRTERGLPFAATLVGGIVHLMFETWLFNFPSILSTYFWTMLLMVNGGSSSGGQGPDQGATALEEEPFFGGGSARSARGRMPV